MGPSGPPNYLVAKTHWKIDKNTACGRSARTVEVSNVASGVSCEICKRKIPAVARSAWDLILDEDRPEPEPEAAKPKPKKPRKPKPPKPKSYVPEEVGEAIQVDLRSEDFSEHHPQTHYRTGPDRGSDSLGPSRQSVVLRVSWVIFWAVIVIGFGTFLWSLFAYARHSLR